MISEQTLRRLVETIHAQPELAGVVIGLHGNQMCRLLHPGEPQSVAYHDRFVLIEETAPGPRSAAPFGVRQTAGGLSPSRLLSGGARTTPKTIEATSPPERVVNSSRVWPELAGAGLSCTFAVISGVGVLGSVAAEIPSAGSSTFLAVLAWTGFVTSSAQCLNGLARTYQIAASPDSNSLQQWDDNAYYSWSVLATDALGVVTGLAALPQATRNLLAVLERHGGLVSLQQLERLTRGGRRQAIQRALAQASRNPDSRKVLQSAMQEAGIGMRAAKSGRNLKTAQKVTQAISAETTRRLQRAVMDVVGGSLSPIASAMPSAWIGSASGSINDGLRLIVNVLNR